MGEILQGVYEKLQAINGTSKNGKDWTAYNVFIDGKKFGLGFDCNLVTGIPEGVPVKYSVSQDDRGYWKIDSIEALPQGTVLAPKAAEGSGGAVQASFTLSQEQSLRQNCYHEASKLVLKHIEFAIGLGNLKTTPQLGVLEKRIIAFADEIGTYVRTGKAVLPDDLAAIKVAQAVAPPPPPIAPIVQDPPVVGSIIPEEDGLPL